MIFAFLQPFLEAAGEVLRAEAEVEVKPGELHLGKGVYVTDEVTVLVNLVGSLAGAVFYGMSQATALALAARIFGEPLEAFNGLAQSGVAELGNVITGRASIGLAQAGYPVDISPPAVILGKGATLFTPDSMHLIVPLHSACGTITIHLALRERANPSLLAG